MSTKPYTGMKFEKVSKKYPGNPRATIESLDLKINPGEFVVLLGPSGCGKSTILRMAAGLIPVSDGNIWIGDRNVTELEPKDRNVAMVFQSYAAFPHLSVRENLAFGMKIRKAPAHEIEQAVKEAAHILQLDAFLDRMPKQLSGGQLQRVALGRALVRKPEVFLFDEPLSNLDAKLRGQMRSEIVRFHQRSKRISLYVTHDQLEAMTMADRIVLLHNGIVQQVGTPLEIYNQPKNMFVAGFLGSLPMNFFQGEIRSDADKPYFITESGMKVRLPVATVQQCAAAPGAKLTLGIRPEDIYREDAIGPDVQKSELVQARVDLAEALGDGGIFHCSAQGQAFKVRLRHQTQASVNQPLKLVMDLQKLHLFSPAGDNISASSTSTGGAH